MVYLAGTYMHRLVRRVQVLEHPFLSSDVGQWKIKGGSKIIQSRNEEWLKTNASKEQNGIYLSIRETEMSINQIDVKAVKVAPIHKSRKIKLIFSSTVYYLSSCHF